MEIKKYKKIGKWNAIASGIAILLNIIAFLISFAIVKIIGQIENVYEIPQKIEEIIGGGVVLSLFNIYIAIWICICMVICCFLAFVIFGIGCVIAKKKPEKLFGFAVAQLIFLAINHSFNIAQLGLNAIFVFVEILFLGSSSLVEKVFGWNWLMQVLLRESICSSSLGRRLPVPCI